MTETILVFLRSSTRIPWKYHDHCLLHLFSIIKSLWTIEFHYLLLTTSSKLSVVSYWIKLLFLSMFILISEIRGKFLSYFPSKRVLRFQTRGIEMREKRECHSSKPMKQLRDHFVKLSRFSLVLFHLIILSSVSIGSFPEPSYPSCFLFRFGCWSANLLTLLPCYLPSVSPPQATDRLKSPNKSQATNSPLRVDFRHITAQ